MGPLSSLNIFTHLRTRGDAKSLNSAFHADFVITCRTVIFWGRFVVMNRYTQYFSSNLNAVRNHLKSHFHDGGDTARRVLGCDDDDGNRGGREGRRVRGGRDGEGEEEEEAQRALETAEEKKLNFNLDAFRPYTVYAMLRWCHMQEYPPTEVPDQFVDGRDDLVNLINHIRVHHLARHISLPALEALSLRHITEILTSPMPLTDFLLAIPEIYSPPSDLSKRRNDALRTLVINRSLSDIDELIAARHWRNVVDRTPQYSSDLTLAVLDLKRNSSDGDGKFSNSMMVIHGGAGDGGFKPIGLVKKRSIWSVWEYMTYLSGWIFQLMLLVLWAKYTGPKIARHFPPDIQHRIRIVTTPIDHCLNTGLRLLWEYTIGNEQLLQNASELTRRVGQGIIKDGSKYLRDLERRTYRVGEHMTDSLAALGDIAGDTAKALPASGVTLGGEVKQKFGDAVEMGMKLAAGSRPEWGNGKWEGLMDGWDEYGYRYGNWGGYGDYDGDYGERDDDDEYTYDGEYDRNYDTNYGGQYNEQY